MYQAKDRGKASIVVFDPPSTQKGTRRAQLLEDLRIAVKQDQLLVLYQPVVQLETGQVDGLEALVRWQHPHLGLLMPAQFLPLAIEHNLMPSIAQRVLEIACHHMRDLRTQFPADRVLSMSINLPMTEFDHGSFADSVRDCLRHLDVDAGQIKLELPENTISYLRPRALDQLQILRELGVQFAISQMELGVSEIQYLQRLSVDTLKINRPIIEGLGRDAACTAMVHAIIAYARALGMNATGVGIETAEQAAQLSRLGCRAGQGVYFSPPLPASAVKGFLMSREPGLSSPPALSRT
jgi:EAL domain-containing protein (putative c-di-GMP-specific phosphodiesterase class I)